MNRILKHPLYREPGEAEVVLANLLRRGDLIVLHSNQRGRLVSPPVENWRGEWFVSFYDGEMVLPVYLLSVRAAYRKGARIFPPVFEQPRLF